MVSRCEKCGQTVLATDRICWHCGAQQSEKKAKSATTKNGRSDFVASTATSLGNTAVVEDAPISLTAVFTYAVFTIICLVIILLILRNLSNQPIFQINPSLDRQADWQSITDANLQFTLDLPPTWMAIENEGNVPTGVFQERMNQLNADVTFTELETRIAGDIVPYMLIHSDELPVYFLIVGSQGLQSVSNKQLMQLVTNSGWDVLRMDEIELPKSGSRVNIAHHLGDDLHDTRCTTQFVSTENERFILMGCAPVETFPQVASEITKMIALFQPLIYKN